MSNYQTPNVTMCDLSNTQAAINTFRAYLIAGRFLSLRAMENLTTVETLRARPRELTLKFLRVPKR